MQDDTQHTHSDAPLTEEEILGGEGKLDDRMMAEDAPPDGPRDGVGPRADGDIGPPPPDADQGPLR